MSRLNQCPFGALALCETSAAAGSGSTLPTGPHSGHPSRISRSRARPLAASFRHREGIGPMSLFVARLATRSRGHPDPAKSIPERRPENDEIRQCIGKPARMEVACLGSRGASSHPGFRHLIKFIGWLGAFGFEESVGILYAGLIAECCRVILVVVRDLVRQSCRIALYRRLSSVISFVLAL
jgi:hypothetical protein